MRDREFRLLVAVVCILTLFAIFSIFEMVVSGDAPVWQLLATTSIGGLITLGGLLVTAQKGKGEKEG